MDKQSLRGYIKTRFLLGLTATQIHGELTDAYGSGVVSYRMLCYWIDRFANGRESLEDDPRAGRPITIVTQRKSDAVKELVEADPHISIDYIAYMRLRMRANSKVVNSVESKKCSMLTVKYHMTYD